MGPDHPRTGADLAVLERGVGADDGVLLDDRRAEQLDAGQQRHVRVEHHVGVDPGRRRVHDADPGLHPAGHDPLVHHPAGPRQLHPVVDALGLHDVGDLVGADVQPGLARELDGVGEVVLALGVVVGQLGQRLDEERRVEGEDPGVDLPHRPLLVASRPAPRRSPRRRRPRCGPPGRSRRGRPPRRTGCSPPAGPPRAPRRSSAATRPRAAGCRRTPPAPCPRAPLRRRPRPPSRPGPRARCRAAPPGSRAARPAPGRGCAARPGRAGDRRPRRCDAAPPAGRPPARARPCSAPPPGAGPSWSWTSSGCPHPRPAR